MRDSSKATETPRRGTRVGSVLTVVAFAIALFAVVLSGTALWRTRGANASSSPPTTVTPTTALGGKKLVTVPSEVNKNGMTAAADLEQYGLKYAITPWPSPVTARNRVISQDPLPDTVVPAGTVISLKVSTGPY
jgi:hypothetical protein